MNNWPIIKLGEVVTHRKEFIEIDDLQTYKRCRVQLHVMGIVLRDEIEGALIKTKHQQICRTNEFLVAEIDAKVGGYGIVPPELNGAIVSSHYFLFTVNETKLDPKFLGYYIKTPFFCNQVSAQGTTNYAAIRPQHVLNYTTPLPPLPEQRRVVAKIEQLAAKIEEARGLRNQAVEEADSVVSSASKYFFDVVNQHVPLVSLASITTRITKGESPEWQGFTYQDSGAVFVRSENVLWGKLDLSKRVYIPLEFHKKLNRSQLCSGDVLINLVGASIGRCCIMPNAIGDANVNQAVAVISPDPKYVESAYLMHFLISSPTQEIIHGGKVETARPNISLTDLRNLILPAPPLDEQRRIVAYLDGMQAQVDRLKALQAQTAAELEALLPSILDKAFKGEL